MNWRRILPNLLTLAAMVAAVFSIIKSAHGEYMQSAQWMMVCLILDGMDGSVARLFKGTTKFGAELDTFVDITAYGVAPALLAYEAVMKQFGLWGLAYTCVTVLSGALRLARFRVADPFRGQRGYLGLPITVNGGWVALFVFVTESGLLHDGRINLASGPLAALVWTCSVAFLCLQVSNVRYGKPTKAPLFFLCGILFVLMLFLKVEIAVASALAMSAYGFFYAFISPFLPKHEHVLDGQEEEEPVTVRHS
jgi:CDP-diacylglycerol---serine O-phosphatidyltransferase